MELDPILGGFIPLFRLRGLILRSYRENGGEFNLVRSVQSQRGKLHPALVPAFDEAMSIMAVHFVFGEVSHKDRDESQKKACEIIDSACHRVGASCAGIWTMWESETEELRLFLEGLSAHERMDLCVRLQGPGHISPVER